jgi:hypothetical protein
VAFATLFYKHKGFFKVMGMYKRHTLLVGVKVENDSREDYDNLYYPDIEDNDDLEGYTAVFYGEPHRGHDSKDVYIGKHLSGRSKYTEDKDIGYSIKKLEQIKQEVKETLGHLEYFEGPVKLWLLTRVM